MNCCKGHNFKEKQKRRDRNVSFFNPNNLVTVCLCTPRLCHFSFPRVITAQSEEQQAFSYLCVSITASLHSQHKEQITAHIKGGLSNLGLVLCRSSGGLGAASPFLSLPHRLFLLSAAAQLAPGHS